MKERDHPILSFGPEINKQVPAANQVELGERGIGDEVLLGKNNQLANLLADSVVVAAVDFNEEPFQSIGRNIDLNAGGGNTLTCIGQSISIDVGGEDLDGCNLFRAGKLFENHHGD